MPSSCPGDPLRPGTLAEAKAQGLTEEEFASINRILGRAPNVTELAIFAAMWSEHCSYKNSILELKTLPRSGEQLLVAAGEENAGLVDIGDGWAVAFKIESHNHPSAVEPFQGATTGVGGILRDIFTMGARPLAVLDSLRFGSLDHPRNRYLLDGVVRGIGNYGNCFGVPTIAGEVCFDPAYSGNPLINVMAVGIVRHDRVARARAVGPGNPVYYVGSRTGRDGIHGATFASEELSADNEAKRPAVQVGDPFAEKLLLEATLELAGTEALAAIQDMGAAGLSCSSSEMSAAGRVGMDLNLDLVPLREKDMDPWEIMLSESQERMLLVAKAGHEDEIQAVFQKWDLEAAELGKVTADGVLRLRHKGRIVAEIPAWHLALGGGAPQYTREYRRPSALDEGAVFDPLTLPEPENPQEVLIRLLADPDICCKEWIFRQYDQSVRTNTVYEPGHADAGVIRVEGTNKGLAVCTDGNGRYVSLDPRRGAALAVVEAARNVACTGARPLAITNCLNFGHPYKPEVYYFFHEVVSGIGEACRALNTPVTGGNVSFYNETNGIATLPTPVIGMLGVMEEVGCAVGSAFKHPDDAVYLLGINPEPGLGGSCYLRDIHGLVKGALPNVDYESEKSLISFLVEAAQQKLLQSAHDVSDGGLAVCLAECCLTGREGWIGASLDYTTTDSTAAHLFGESPGRAVVSVSPENESRLVELGKFHKVPILRLGQTGGKRLVWRDYIDCLLDDLAQPYFQTLPQLME
ncbi:MAG: phosphoribosylformylglycinamidine synthase subunit PurL [Calditrichota bacterium]